MELTNLLNRKSIIKDFEIDLSYGSLIQQIRYTKRFLVNNSEITRLFLLGYNLELICVKLSEECWKVKKVIDGIIRFNKLEFLKKKFSYETKYPDIIEQLENGVTQAKIYKNTGISIKTINNVNKHIKKYKEIKSCYEVNSFEFPKSVFFKRFCNENNIGSKKVEEVTQLEINYLIKHINAIELLKNDYNQREVAKDLGMSVTTINKVSKLFEKYKKNEISKIMVNFTKSKSINLEYRDEILWSNNEVESYLLKKPSFIDEDIEELTYKIEQESIVFVEEELTVAFNERFRNSKDNLIDSINDLDNAVDYIVEKLLLNMKISHSNPDIIEKAVHNWKCDLKENTRDALKKDYLIPENPNIARYSDNQKYIIKKIEYEKRLHESAFYNKFNNLINQEESKEVIYGCVENFFDSFKLQIIHCKELEKFIKITKQEILKKVNTKFSKLKIKTEKSISNENKRRNRLINMELERKLEYEKKNTIKHEIENRSLQNIKSKEKSDRDEILKSPQNMEKNSRRPLVLNLKSVFDKFMEAGINIWDVVWDSEIPQNEIGELFYKGSHLTEYWLDDRTKILELRKYFQYYQETFLTNLKPYNYQKAKEVLLHLEILPFCDNPYNIDLSKICYYNC